MTKQGTQPALEPEEDDIATDASLTEDIDPSLLEDMVNPNADLEDIERETSELNKAADAFKNEHGQQFKDGKERMEAFIINGIIRDKDPVCQFFSKIIKQPLYMQGALACVVATEATIKLFYDPLFTLSASKEELKAVLQHELLHVLNEHFTRGDEMAANLGIEKDKFYKEYAPFADLPVNATMETTTGYKELLEHPVLLPDGTQAVNKKTNEPMTIGKGFLTYDTVDDIDPSKNESLRTYDGIVRHLFMNPQKHKKAKDQAGIGDAQVIEITITGDMNDVSGKGNDGSGQPQPGNGQGDSDGSGKPGSGSGDQPGDGKRTIIIPESAFDPEIAKEGIKEIVKKALDKSAGSMDQFRTVMEEFITLAKEDIDRGYIFCEQFLRRLATRKKARRRSTRRLSRRTKLPPGYIRNLGYRALFTVDESGSMSDAEVQYLFELVQRASMSGANDRLFVCHWTEHPYEIIDEVKTRTQAADLTRKVSGGTDFSTIFTDDLIRSQDIDAHIIVTDGEPYGGENNGWPVGKPHAFPVWIITTEHGWNRFQREYQDQGLPGAGMYVPIDPRLYDDD